MRLVRTSVRGELAVEPDYLSRSDEEYVVEASYIGNHALHIERPLDLE